MVASAQPHSAQKHPAPSSAPPVPRMRLASVRVGGQNGPMPTLVDLAAAARVHAESGTGSRWVADVLSTSAASAAAPDWLPPTISPKLGLPAVDDGAGIQRPSSARPARPARGGSATSQRKDPEGRRPCLRPVSAPGVGGKGRAREDSRHSRLRAGGSGVQHQRLVRRAPTTAARRDSDPCRARLAENANFAKRLANFDRRFHRQLREAVLKQSFTEGDDGSWLSGSSKEADASQAPTAVSERPLRYKLVDASSQRSAFPLSNLLSEVKGARWETLQSRVRNEYVVMELEAPGTCTAARMILTGTSATPKHGRIEYSEESPRGPWTEAWRFKVDSLHGNAEDNSYWTRHEYCRIPRLFRDMVLDYYGSIQDAREALDTQGNGAFSFQDAQMLLQKLRMQDPGGIASRINGEQLCQQLDLDGTNMIFVDDFLSLRGLSPPVALWWRLYFNDNWGSPTCIALHGGLELLTTAPIADEGIEAATAARSKALSLVEEFVSPMRKAQVPTNRICILSSSFDMPADVAGEMFADFKALDTEGKNSITQEEFAALLMKLRGVKDKSEISPMLTSKMFKQVDTNRDGRIDFYEFARWYQKHIFEPEAACWEGRVRETATPSSMSSEVECSSDSERVQYVASCPVERVSRLKPPAPIRAKSFAFDSGKTRKRSSSFATK